MLEDVAEESLAVLEPVLSADLLVLVEVFYALVLVEGDHYLVLCLAVVDFVDALQVARTSNLEVCLCLIRNWLECQEVGF